MKILILVLVYVYIVINVTIDKVLERKFESYLQIALFSFLQFLICTIVVPFMVLRNIWKRFLRFIIY